MSPGPTSSYSASDMYSPSHLPSESRTFGGARSPFQMGEGSRQTYHPASGGDSEDEYESSEDWNVYDDFNNNRPITNDQQLPTSATAASHLDRTTGDARLSRLMSDGAAAGTDSRRQTLLSAHAFGFDAQNTDPNAVQHPSFSNSVQPYSDAPSGLHSKSDSAAIELITVPALGTEFTDAEVKAMQRPRKRSKKARARVKSGGRWLISDDRCCGCLNPRTAVILMFALLAALAVMLYFVIPRVPIIAVQSTHPLVAIPDGASMKTHHKPTNFSMDMRINLRADNTGGWVPLHLRKMEMKVVDITTSKLVGEGVLNDQVLPGGKKTIFQFPVSFAYASINATGDETWLHWINACGPTYQSTPRQSLSLRFSMSMYINGLIGQRGTSTQLADLECPFTLQPDQT